MALRKSTALRNMLLGKGYNKVTNGSFESDTSGWTADSANLELFTGGGVNSGNALKITNSSDAQGSAYQEISVESGKPVIASAYLQAGDSGIRMLIGTTTNPSAYYDSGVVSDSSWTKKEVVFIPTEDTVVIRFKLESATANQYAYADEAYLSLLDKSLKSIFTGGKIRIYTGSQPSSADDAPTGTLLVTITGEGGKLHFDEPNDGSLSKKSDELWSGTAVADGTAGWFRLSPSGDDDSAGDKIPRIDGAVATSGAELNMANTYISNGSLQTISSFVISISE